MTHLSYTLKQTQPSTKPNFIAGTTKLIVPALFIMAFCALFFAPILSIVPFTILSGIGIFKLVQFWKELNALDFTADHYSITMEEIIDDLEYRG